LGYFYIKFLGHLKDGMIIMDKQDSQNNKFENIIPSTPAKWVGGVIQEDGEIVLSNGMSITFVKEYRDAIKKKAQITHDFLQELGGKTLMKMFKKKLKKKYGIEI
jgi:hypothetical protein